MREKYTKYDLIEFNTAVSRAKCNTSRVTEQELDPWG